MNPNREICIMAYRATIERITLLYSGILLFCAHRGNGDFSLLHGLQAQKHCSTHKLVWKSMNPSREMCIIAHRVIIERVALLYIEVLLFYAQDHRGKM